ncbi:uncharacterized protein ARMOST_02923 [Armillaria ostoyae]|uniref:Uncharacterized protein n=1 Tax=Armillaria ostoyae TaxID=47428 RepID=A0A284QT15_ARMOS|nr:uncharacterized protein ARMOST_02923 [Armillaria ostoyae]
MASFLVHGLALLPSESFTSSQRPFKSLVFSPFTFDSGEKIVTDGEEMYWEGVGTGRDENYIRSDPSHYRRPQNDMLTEKRRWVEGIQWKKEEEDVVRNDWLFGENYTSIGATTFGMLFFASRLGVPFWGAALSNMILPRERHSSRCLFLETV